MTVDPDPLAERQSTSEEVEDDGVDQPDPEGYRIKGTHENETINKGCRSIDGDPRSVLRRVEEAKEAGQ